jgi:2-dehydropantoate 2-reductase
MLRDIERGGPIEADHIVGDLLRIAYAHLKAYEARRKRENAASEAAGAVPPA